jgi:hypothetical protein
LILEVRVLEGTGGFVRRSIKVLFAALVTAGIARPQQWQTEATWNRSLFQTVVKGTLLLNEDGVEFRSTKLLMRWPYVEIHSFDVTLYDLKLLSYQNRPWHQPGARPFRFTLMEPMPADVAAEFSARVGKPVRDGAPVPSAPAVSEIPAHRRTWSGGSNGTLRLKDDGIDYVTLGRTDSRSWRWTDIQTIANPNPYELRVDAFREIVEFDLKTPLSRGVFERMWDHLYAIGLNVSPGHAEVHQ